MLRVKEAGDSALLLELGDRIDPAVNARVIAIAAAVNGAGIAGVRDVVPTFRSVAVYIDPLVADVARLRALLQQAASAAPAAVSGRTIEVPVAYGGDAGPDLSEVAAYARVSTEHVIARHASVDYRVYMLGFLPGFAYMGLVPPEIAMPRRQTPRLRVAAGSVGIAGPQTAIYPRASPGGWQVIGRTSMEVFDPGRRPAALFAPGDTVRFVPVPDTAGPQIRTRPPVAAAHLGAGDGPPEAGSRSSDPASPTARRTITVLQPGLYTTVQDSGRWGHQSTGVSVSGALDGRSHRLANALVGNDKGAATLEVTLAGPELRLDDDATVAITGARLSPTRDGASVAMDAPVALRRGTVLRFGERLQGTRAYVAFDGGIAVPTVLGSRATQALTALGGLGGRPLVRGDVLPLGPGGPAPARRRADVDERAIRGGARVRVLPGPQDDFFPAHAFESLQRSRFHVAPQSDRMGYRLVGAVLPRLPDREMISDATFPGAIQVPASGEPILLMADRQTTGGYPQIATVITADLPLAGQLAPGDWIEFEICTRAEALDALVKQEGKLLAVE